MPIIRKQPVLIPNQQPTPAFNTPKAQPVGNPIPTNQPFNTATTTTNNQPPKTHNKQIPFSDTILESQVTDSRLDFWIRNEMNVLMVGKKGTGKTERILEAFKRSNLRYLYFSAATMDPWVDFIGVPKEVTENGVTYLDLIRPKALATDTVDAIFLDEANRAPKKVRNAVMELIQFKSINGKKFNNLKIVWAAINPDDGEEQYDVEILDPAQLDRFHVHVKLPYAPDKNYFTKKYNTDMAERAIEWWHGLTNEVKNMVSPRRLDYALSYFIRGGELKEILPIPSNVQKLAAVLNTSGVQREIELLYSSQDTNKAVKFIRNENNYDAAITYILKEPKYLDFFLPHFPSDKKVALMTDNDDVLTKIVSGVKNTPQFAEVIANIKASKMDAELIARIASAEQANVSV